MFKCMMKFALAILLGLAATTFAAPTPSLVKFFDKLQAGHPETVVVYGTSLTAGGAWTGAMKQWFDSEFPNLVTFANCAKGGANSDWGAKNIGKVLARHPDLVFIEFSYNDSIDDLMPVETAWGNLDSMVKAIRKQNPEACIVLQTMNVGWDAPNGRRTFSRRANLEKYNENYRRYAREQGLPLIDHYPVWLHLKETEPAKYQGYIPDGTHPTPAGSLAVTWPVVKAFLSDSLVKKTAP